MSRRTPASDRARALEGLRVLVGALSHSARTVERTTGITNAQLFLLQQLDSAGALTVNDLAARARTQQSTASIVVARLARAGLVKKGRSPTDGRLAVVSLTAKARRLLRHAPAPPVATLLRAIEKLTAHQARSLANNLQILTAALDLSPPAVTLMFEPASTRTSSRPATRRKA